MLGTVTLNGTVAWLTIGAAAVTIVVGLIAVKRWAERAIVGMLRSLARQMEPNGLDTDHIGDMAKRTENAITDLTTQVAEHAKVLDRHIRSERATRAALRRDIKALRDRSE